MKSDVVVFHRPFENDSIEAIKLFKEHGCKIVVDNDDTYDPESGTPTKVHGMDYKEAISRINDNLKRAIAEADMVTVSTDHLKREYDVIHDNVKILPNMIEPYDWDEPMQNDSETVRIGIWGSAASEQEFEHIKPLLEDLSVNQYIQLVVFAFPSKDFPETRKTYKNDIAYWEKLGAEIHNLVGIADYRTVLNDLKLDIGIIPRADNYFNRAKSNIKFLEAAMVKTPVIGQGFSTGDSPYQGKDSKYLAIADGLDEWREKVAYWVENPLEAKQAAERAYDYVLKEYDINQNIDKWKDAYKSTLNE